MTRGARSARSAGKVSIAVFLSRILGLVRDQFFAKLFGAGLYNDAWVVAFRIPNVLRDLFAEGALSAAVVPTFTEHLRKQGRASAWQLANLVLSLLLVLLGLVSLVLFLFSDFFVYGLAPGFSDVPGKVEVTSMLVKILAPFLLMVASASVAMGVLNALGHYFWPALAPAFFNVALILSALLLVPVFEGRGYLPIFAMGCGALIGGVLQFVVQLPLLRREGFRFQFRVNWQHPGIRRIRRLLGPALIGVSAVQINVLVNTLLASLLQDNGPVSWLMYAFRIMYLPIGLFGVAVGIVNLKEVSVFAAHEQYQELKETVANSLKLISFLAVPSTIGLIVLGVPIVRVLFERGDFTPQDTSRTAWALMAYALGLLAYSCNKVYVPTFYALSDTRTPVRITLGAVVVNLAANLALIALLPEPYRYIGLALGTSISVSLSNRFLAASFERRLGSLDDFGVLPALMKNLTAAAMMGAVIWFARPWAETVFIPVSLFGKVASLALLIGTGGSIYLLACRVLGVRELGYFFPFLRSRSL